MNDTNFWTTKIEGKWKTDKRMGGENGQIKEKNMYLYFEKTRICLLKLENKKFHLIRKINVEKW